MAFVPRDLPPENVNVSPNHPLKELLWLLGGLAAIILGLYLILGLAVDWVVPHLSPHSEAALGKIFTSLYNAEEQGPQATELEHLLSQLSQELPQTAKASSESPYRVHLVHDPTVNAVALPGGDIVVFSGLLDQARSENELAFVLGHELGHLYARHSLKRLGRSLVLITLSDLLLGEGNIVSGTVSHGLNGLQMSFSRRQETEADEMGLKLVTQLYGHAGGVTDFFERLAQKHKISHLGSYFATHPHPEQRVQHLKALIRTEHLPVQAVKILASPPPVN